MHTFEFIDAQKRFPIENVIFSKKSFLIWKERRNSVVAALKFHTHTEQVKCETLTDRFVTDQKQRDHFTLYSFFHMLYPSVYPPPPHSLCFRSLVHSVAVYYTFSGAFSLMSCVVNARKPSLRGFAFAVLLHIILTNGSNSSEKLTIYGTIGKYYSPVFFQTFKF